MSYQASNGLGCQILPELEVPPAQRARAVFERIQGDHAREGAGGCYGGVHHAVLRPVWKPKEEPGWLEGVQVCEVLF